LPGSVQQRAASGHQGKQTALAVQAKAT
jgi:hypothetical protein